MRKSITVAVENQQRENYAALSTELKQTGDLVGEQQKIEICLQS